MRLLVDECLSGHIVEAFRRNGHDAAWAATDCAGADDGSVMARAVSESRILVTQDRGIGDRAVSGAATAIGVVIVGTENRGESLDAFAARTATRIEAIGENGLMGKLTILRSIRTRQRDLPVVADRT